MAIVQFPFDIRNIDTAEAFRAKAAEAGYEVPLSGDVSVLRKPFSLNGRRIENSMAIQPLEGLDGGENGAPSELTLARYEKLAAQGAGIIWVEATAVCPEGRDSLHQLWINENSRDGFARLVRRIDEFAAKAGHKPPYKVLQLTHSGRCSRDSAGNPAPMAAFASPYLDPLMGTPQIVTDEYLDRLQEQVGEAAALACQAGFDAVELKLCHQYLFKELLCAYTRGGKYGGSQENRFRFAMGAIDQIRRRAGSRMDIVVRLNVYDGIPWPYGWGMQPGSEGTPKNILPIGDEQVVAKDRARSSRTVQSNWTGNPDAASAAGTVVTNWAGNPAPMQISAQEKSSWQGNPRRQEAGGLPSNWSGNPSAAASPGTVVTNWKGNPSPLQISAEEKSSWQGNPRRDEVEGSAPSNWPGNPDAASVQTAPAAGNVVANWTGNPSQTAPAKAEAPQAQAANPYAIPPMPGPMRPDLTEVKELMRQLYRKGVRLFNLTTTSPRFAPEGNGYLNNFRENAVVDPLAGETALLAATREIRQQLQRELSGDIRIVGTGLSWFGPFSANAGAGGVQEGWFDIAGFGRSVMADNDFVPSILKGVQPLRGKACIGCDNCFRLFFAGLPTGCPMQHSAYRDLLSGILQQEKVPIL